MAAHRHGARAGSSETTSSMASTKAERANGKQSKAMNSQSLSRPLKRCSSPTKVVLFPQTASPIGDQMFKYQSPKEKKILYISCDKCNTPGELKKKCTKMKTLPEGFTNPRNQKKESKSQKPGLLL